MSEHCVYVCFSNTGAPFWIGVTKNLRRRKSELKQRHGALLFAMLPIHEGLNEQTALTFESALILAIGRKPEGPLLNQATYGTVRGHRFSIEHRKKIGQANSGKIRTEEMKAVQSAIKLGKRHTEETKAKMRASHLGKPHNLSEKGRERIQEANRRRKQHV